MRCLFVWFCWMACSGLLAAQEPAQFSSASEERLAQGGSVRVIVEMVPVAADGLVTADQAREAFLRTTFGDTRPGSEIDGFGRFLRADIADNSLLAEIQASGLAALRNHPLVEAIHEDRPHVIATQEIGDNVGTAPLRLEGLDGSGTILALLDTGVDLDHPFYASQLLEGACFSTPSENTESLCPNGEASMIGGNAGQACAGIDGCEHGTAAAGVMVGSNADLVGVAPGARLIPIQIFTRVTDAAICGSEASCLRAWTSDIRAAASWLNSLQGEDFTRIPSVLINSSPFYDPDFDPSHLGVISQNVGLQDASFFMPAGNDGVVRRFRTTTEYFPRYVVLHVVQALGPDGRIAPFSNDVRLALETGLVDTARPVYAAPGVDVMTSLPGGEMGTVSGTSIAAAQVAAAHALVTQTTDGRAPYIPMSFFNGEAVVNVLANMPIQVYDAGLLSDWFDWAYYGYDLLRNSSHSGGPILKTYLYIYLGGDRMIFEGSEGGPFDFRNGNDQAVAVLEINNPDDLDATAESSVPWLNASIFIDESGSRPDYDLHVSPNALAEGLAPGIYTGRVRVELDGERYSNGPVTLIVNGPTPAGLDNAPWLSGQTDNGFQPANPDADRQWWRWTPPEDGNYLVRINSTEYVGAEGTDSQRAFEITTGTDEADLQAVPSYLRCLRGAEYPGFFALAPWASRFYARAGEQYNFSFAGSEHASRAFIQPSLNQHVDDPSQAEIIEQSTSQTHIVMQVTDTLCRPSPRMPAGGLYNGPDRATLRFRPDETGRHAFWLTNNGWIHRWDLNPPLGTISLYDSTRQTLLMQYVGSGTINHNGNAAGFADLEAGEDYWLVIETDTPGGQTLYTEGPETTAGPANDDFANATILDQRNYLVPGDNLFASRESFAADEGGLGRSLWWRFTPDIDAQLETYVDANFPSSLRIFTGDDAESLLLQAEGAPPIDRNIEGNYPRIYMPISAGETYFLRLDGDHSRTGNFNLSVRWGTPPDNDDFEDAEILALGETVSANNTFATHQPGERIEADMEDRMVSPAEYGLWYRFTAPESVRYRVEVRANEIQPQIGVYQGSSVEQLDYFGHNVSRYTGPPSEIPLTVSWIANAGEEYFIRVSAYRLEMGDFDIRVSRAGPPNDDLNGRIRHSQGVGGTLTDVTSNEFATAEWGELTSIGDLELTGSLWYEITGVGDWVVNTSGSSIDTVVYRGSFATIVDHNDNAGPDVLSSRLEGNRRSTDYYNAIGVAGANGARGNIRVNIGPPDQIQPRLASALLPYARSGQVGQPVTTFATVLNSGYATARDCRIDLADPGLPIDFQFQPTNSATNALSGNPGETRLVEAGQAISYLLAFTPTAAFDPQDVELVYSCDAGAVQSASITGVNTFYLSASETPAPDVLGIAATVGNTGIAEISSTNNRGFFTTASVNIGDADSVTFSADTGGVDLPLTLLVCETDMAQGGACIGERAPSVTVNMSANAVRTFAIFATASGDIPFVPRTNRIFARWTDSGGTVRGATSVAVRTQ